MLKQWLANFEEILCGGFLLVMVVTVIVNVLLRYLTPYSLFWAEELATICFVWAVFIGASATFKRKMDISIDVVVNALPRAWQSWLRLFVAVGVLILSLFIFYISIVFTVIAIEKPTAVFGVSSAVVNSALIVSFGLISWHALRFLISAIAAKFSTGKNEL